MTERLGFFAPCPKGVESLLAEELRRLGIRGVRPQRSGVLFSGRVADGLKAVFCSRLATRVLLTIAEVDASSADALYAAVKELRWEDHVRAGGTLAVDAAGTNDALRNTQFTAVRVKDAIADRFRDLFGRRPSVDAGSPDLRVNVAVRTGKATVSVDLAGIPLHRRGYREPGVQVAAPIKETLAAAVLEIAGWREVFEQGGAFVDPLCGSGTLAIEAALMAADIAPGLIRGPHPVERWLGFDPEAWARIVRDARRRSGEGRRRLPAIVASDLDPSAVAIARRCVQRAGLEGAVRVDVADVATLAQTVVSQQPPGPTEPPGLIEPRGPIEPPGLIATNPPWGERLSDRRDLPALYTTLGDRLREGFQGWRLAVVSPDPGLPAGLRLTAEKVADLGTGKGAARVSLFRVTDATSSETGGPTQVVRGVDEFANRLAKMQRHYAKWARRGGVSCYRVYDADLPDFAFAIDLYQGAGPSEGQRWVHLAEYAPPAGIDPSKAGSRLEAAVDVCAREFDVPSGDVFVKRRERQRGETQYGRRERRGATGIVSENGLLFEVNLSDYLDTGLFLDHRDTRLWLRELAPGTRFLNLFAYTGTATVYAAAGGASTATIDLSRTYLDWAERNLKLNGLHAGDHSFEQANVLAWLESARTRGDVFDLVFCDPPTFSTSKSMEGTFDVQRDHAALIASIGAVLAEEGRLLFSCNRKRFELDCDALAAAGLTARDVTARTIPKDFERTPTIHRCWMIGRT